MIESLLASHTHAPSPDIDLTGVTHLTYRCPQMPMPNQPKTPARSVRIPDEIWTELQRLATEHGVPVSTVIRDLLTEALQTRGGTR